MSPDLAGTLTTARAPGGLAQFIVWGDVGPLLESLTGRPIDADLRPHHVDVAGIDDGLVVRSAEEWAFLTPHAGPRVVARLWRDLVRHGVSMVDPAVAPPAVVFPEAQSTVETLVSGALARAESPDAIDLLLAQPERWRRWDGVWTPDDATRSARLDRLLVAPTVCVAGVPNAGKSTLTNALAGRAWSVTDGTPGTTRDTVAGRLTLGGLVVQWLDTAGLRPTSDRLEQAAIDRQVRHLDDADLLVAVAEPGGRWPALSRSPDLRVATKADVGRRDDAAIAVSARTGVGLTALQGEITEGLVPRADRQNPRPWRFDARLEALCGRG